MERGFQEEPNEYGVSMSSQLTQQAASIGTNTLIVTIDGKFIVIAFSSITILLALLYS